MATRKIGIFRQATLTRDITEDTDISTMPPATKQIIKMWNNVSGQYVLYQENLIEHQVMKLAHYTHISSPIRRLIDFLNQVWIFHAFHFMTPSPEATLFFNQWLEQLSYINTSMRSIRKIQTDCEVLHRCTTDPGLLQNPHTGTLFDKLRKNDGGFVYMVYLEDLRLLTRFKTYEEYDNYSSHPFQLFLFLDEHSLKKKIRIKPV
jgi:exoribonuclease R